MKSMNYPQQATATSYPNHPNFLGNFYPEDPINSTTAFQPQSFAYYRNAQGEIIAGGRGLKEGECISYNRQEGVMEDDGYGIAIQTDQNTSYWDKQLERHLRMWNSHLN